MYRLINRFNWLKYVLHNCPLQQIAPKRRGCFDGRAKIPTNSCGNFSIPTADIIFSNYYYGGYNHCASCTRAYSYVFACILYSWMASHTFSDVQCIIIHFVWRTNALAWIDTVSIWHIRAYIPKPKTTHRILFERCDCTYHPKKRKKERMYYVIL